MSASSTRSGLLFSRRVRSECGNGARALLPWLLVAVVVSQNARLVLLHARRAAVRSFYNLCYAGGTTWWVVQDADRDRFDEYVVAQARDWYRVPTDVQLSKAEQEAMRGLLYTKHVVLHSEDLAAAGIRLTEIAQAAGQLVVGRGDVIHFGMATMRPDLPASRAHSVNEAVNFMPVERLTTGLPRLAEWMQCLNSAWLPMQAGCGLRGKGKRKLAAAMRHWYTNRLVGLHAPAHWTYAFLLRLRECMTGSGEQGMCATRRAIEQHLQGDERLRACTFK